MAGKYCNTTINYCAASTCQNGTCVNGATNFTCLCFNGYTDANCSTQINYCAAGICNNGNCTNLVGGYQCTCLAGYTGTNCTTNINECASNPCQNLGTCNDHVNGFNCTCPSGYTGLTCNNITNNCASNPCLNNATCVNGVNRYTCTCAPGYTGFSKYLKIKKKIFFGKMKIFSKANCNSFKQLSIIYEYTYQNYISFNLQGLSKMKWLHWDFMHFEKMYQERICINISWCLNARITFWDGDIFQLISLDAYKKFLIYL